jgi:hypothetical protein
VTTDASALEGSAAPDVAYQRLRDARVESARLLARRAAYVSNARLGVFLLALVAAFLVFGRQGLSPAALVALLAGFVALVVWHDLLLRRLAWLGRAIGFCDRGLSRVSGHWPELPAPGVPIPPEHPYCEDLDCLGPGSLLHRICEARTHGGQERLAAWLLAPAAPDEVRERQGAIAELRGQLALRETVAGVGEEALEMLDAGDFVAWGRAPQILDGGPGRRWLAAALSFATLAGLGVWIFTSVGALPLLVAALVQLGFAAHWRAGVRRVLEGVETPARELVFLTELLEPLEARDFESPRLRALQQHLLAHGERASTRVAELRRLVDLLDARRNQLFAPFAALLLWSTQLAHAIEAWRADNGESLGQWVDTLAEFEALLSLAGYAFERPEDVFPELVEGDVPTFEAEGLAHPLLGSDARVRNDVSFGQQPRLLVISGSNMSGKSTLLRAVGANTLLALAGAPVCATRLRLSPVQLAASVHVQDSLLAGHSRFYAEVRRLRRVYELATGSGSAPTLYLLDEMLHGTNAEERRLGAERLVRALLEARAAGLVTTHDLALTELADALAPRARNAHFVDLMGSDGLHFDYRLRDGPATTGNALALMRSQGLPV